MTALAVAENFALLCGCECVCLCACLCVYTCKVLYLNNSNKIKAAIV